MTFWYEVLLSGVTIAGGAGIEVFFLPLDDMEGSLNGLTEGSLDGLLTWG